MKNIERKDWIVFFCLIAVAVLGEILFFYKQGNPMVDIGREFYISERVSEGAVLYKDLFNIYGPLAYQINAVLFKVFGVHTDVLYIFGNITGLCIISSIYVLSRHCLTRFYSAIITLFAIFNGIFNSSNFNFIVPYSFGLSYGLLSILISLIFLVKYANSPERERNLYLSAVFAGASVCCKYDYFPYLFIYVYVIWALKIFDLKKLLKLAGSFLVVPFLSIFPLFLNGLTINHISQTAILMKKIATAPSLIYFYKNGDIFVSFKTIKNGLSNFLIFGIPFIIVYKILSYLQKIGKLYSSVFLIFILTVFTAANFHWNFSVMIPPLAVVCSIFIIFKYKEITKADCLIIITAILLSLKTFFTSGINFYCVVSSVFLILAVILLFKKYYVNHEYALKSLLVVFLAVIFIPQVFFAITQFEKFQGSLKTDRGSLKAGSSNSPEKMIAKILLEKTDKNDKVVILPEGHMINFLIDRKSDDMYNNFIPMYVEAFGEQNVIDHYAKNKPDYFVLSTRDTLEYGKEFICKDYAMDLCDWIFNNYTLLYKIVGMPEYFVLRKR